MVVNKKIILVRRPTGIPDVKHFSMIEEELKVDLKSGEILVRIDWVAVDPAQRVWISGKKTYYDPVALQGVINAWAVGRVVKSKSPLLKRGTNVSGLLGWQEFCITPASQVMKIPPHDNPRHYLGVLGVNGMAAYFGFLDLCKPRKHETLVVSAAAGSVGSVVCQLAKMRNLKVIGIAGTDDKCEWVVKELNAQACINYKKTENLASAIRRLCPNGVDIYFDNVGGHVLDAIFTNINRFGRIVLCGALSTYNDTVAPPIHNYP